METLGAAKRGSAARPEAMGPRPLTEDELVRWGRAIGAEVEPPVWIALYGELGAGKSVLARAVCEGAGVGGWIPSPTFILMSPYRTRRGITIVHADLYRIERDEELDGLGWNDLLREGSQVVLVEWADRAGHRLPPDRWDITLEHAGPAELRRVRAAPVGRPPALPPFPEPREACG